ncbi:VWA domain-containing protein [Maribacter sp. 2307UL18-2]|uniref:VWA domain-containing protein n=1 Tax=Maribacter sp. 2307UL18-2 TaxID=3386274 RepID=UPI0039BD388B
MGSTTNQFFGHLWRISFKNFLGILLLGLFFIPNVSNAQIDYCTSCSGNGAECDNPTTNPNNNPDLTASCGELDIVFVLDESNSINTTAEINAVRQGTLSFLNSLSCTGTRVAMVEFGTTARILNNYRDVDDDYVNDVTDYFDGTNNAGVGNLNYRDASATGNAGATNWQAAMLAVDEFAVPDVILFFTDGVPTAWSTGQNPTKDSATSFCGSSNGSSTQPPEIANPVKLSNKLKGEGAHMFMLGVGMGANASTLQQMAGNNELTPTNGGTLGTSDYILEDFAGLAECLVTLVSNVCPFDSDVTSADVCTGDTTGSAEISVPNNFLPFGYAYFNDVTNVELGSGTSSVSPLMISGLGVGSYRVEVLVEVPGENCTRTESFFFDIQESPSPILTAVPSDSSCFGEDDGAIDITASGGTPPFVYAWTTTNGSGLVPTDEDQTGLSPGEYEVMVTDDNGCTASDTITIEEPDEIEDAVIEIANATCDAAGTATITNYDAALTYTFVPNDGTTVGAGGVISGFVPGTDYTVTASSEAQNGDDCSSQPVDFNVSPATDAPDQPVVEVTDATCDAAGTATITNYDAALTYTFAPNDGTTVGAGGTISGFVPGTDYTVTASSEAQNGDDCSSQPVDFNVSPATDAPDQPVVEVTDATCDTAGTATITNYDAALTYTFAPNDGTTVGAGGVISGFVPGTDYTVTASSEAQNGDDCSSQPADFGIIEPTPPNAGDDNEITVCDGASVDLTSLVTESDGTFSEAMISGGLDGDSFDTTGLSPGSYEIIYTVEAGQLCPADTATITIHVAEPVDAGADNTISVCEGTVVDLSELVTVPGGTFSATNGGSVNGNEFDTSGLSPGDYSIEYTVDGGDFCPDDTALITVSVAEDIIVQTCEAVDATSCNDGTTRFNFYWFGSNASPGGSNAFGSNATNNLSFTEFNDGTALIQGTTVLGSCTAALYIKLVGKTDWAGWQLEGGTFKKMGCTNPDPTMLHYYVIDNTVSTITTTGGDCLEEGTFIVSQKPDPNDPLTPHLGVVMGPGGVLHGVDPTATGIAGWGFMGPENDPKKYDIDFNFELDCEDATGCEIKVEICDGIDNDGDGQIDEGFDSDGDGIADCEDVEECDGIDNDGDLLVDEGFDSDMDGTADCFDEEICDGLDNDGDGEIDEGLSCGDIEVCDGVDNDGDGEIDEGFDDTDNDGIADCVDPCDNRFDSDGDNIPDCEDVEECDGLDNDGDGMVDEGFADTDNDGTADCQDVEECDGLDNDGDGEIDEGFDSDGDGTPDCQDVEECDGLDNDGDGTIDEGFADTDGDGIADCIDVEECDGKDNDGDGEIDEGFDSDGDGTPDCRDIEECDGVDNDGDGEIDEDLDCTEVCDGIDNDGDGEVDEGFDSDGDGTPDCEDTEECDGVDNDGDGEIDEGFDSDGDGTADCEDTEECDGVDNDGDGEIDEGFDSDGDGTPDCEDTEECDGVDNDGDGEIDEGFDSDGDGTADCEDTEECDGVDNDGDGEIDEGFDSDGDGTPDCEDTEECDGVDNDGDGEIDEDLNCDDAPEGCETAFARLETNNTCFLDDGFNRWGWTNQLTTEGNYTMDLYSGAGQCDLTKGEKSGTVEVEYSNGSVTVSIELSPGFVMTEAQLYVGGAPYPVKGNNPTVAPGQYPVKEEGLDKVTRLDFDPIDVSHITGDLYIIVHAVTCEVETDDSTAKTEVQAFPMTFKNELNLRVEIPYDSNLTVEMFDVNGRCVLEKGGMSLKTGKNDIRLNLSNMAPDVYILILNTERERIIKKVMSRK